MTELHHKEAIKDYRHFMPLYYRCKKGRTRIEWKKTKGASTPLEQTNIAQYMKYKG